MWSLLDGLPNTHRVEALGKLDYRSGGHTIQARLSSWLGAAGIDKPSYRFDSCQSIEIAESTSPRCHEDDWQLADRGIAFLEQQSQPPQLFDVVNDPGELRDLSTEKPQLVTELDAELRKIVDYEQTHRDWQDCCKSSFRQWRRQAKRGLYVDGLLEDYGQ